MKKKIILFLTLLIIMPISVMADNIYKIDMNVYIDEFGNASIKEVWDVKADYGSEWYKTMYELNNSELTDYKVYMDSKELQYKEYWDINESISDKNGYYGINNTSKGIELCFGKGDFKRHTYTLTYNLSNYIFNTDDSQVLAWVLMPKTDMDNYTIEVSSYYSFPDTLDVWGYGAKGYAYVENGKIKMSNEGSANNNYVSLLVKFPLNTFKTDNKDNRYNNFHQIFSVAEAGKFNYDYDTDNKKNNLSDYFFMIVGFLSWWLLPFLIVFSFINNINNKKYGYKDNKKIVKEKIPMFRDIPCDKDIYYVNALIKLNDFGYKESNILGAIILKWVKEKKIGFKNETKGIFNRKTSVIDLTLNKEFTNPQEKELFDIMYKASIDGLLEAKELEKWCKKNYSKFLSLFNRITDDKITDLKEAGHIYKRVNRKECKYKNIMDDKIYNDSVKLYGLKKYLIEFSNMNTKEVMDVHLWDEYLMFAYLFGIADKVAKQFKNMYPEVIEQMDINYDALVFVNNLSVRSVSVASSARRAATNYSSGGGGFSSGGGGGFSGGFSGGGGGCAGGR